MKKVIKRNLPINDNYKIVDSYYSSIIDNGGSICANCSKVISNIAIVENSNNQKFDVGLDCAETLTNLSGLLSVQMNFAEAKGIRAKISKAKKNNKIVSTELAPNGQIVLKIDNISVEWITQDFAQKYLPETIKILTNANKIGFKPYETTIIDIDNLKGIERHNKLLSLLNTPQILNVLEFEIVCSLKDGLKSDGTPNGSKLFTWDIKKNNETLEYGSTYNAIDFNFRANWSLNKILLNNYTN